MRAVTTGGNGAGQHPGAQPAVLRQMLHDVAQPLTVLAMLLEEVGVQPGSVSSEELLQLARAECGRAVGGVRLLQATVAGVACASPAEEALP